MATLRARGRLAGHRTLRRWWRGTGVAAALRRIHEAESELSSLCSDQARARDAMIGAERP